MRNRDNQKENRKVAQEMRTAGKTEQEISQVIAARKQPVPRLRERCISYHNSERYADPTAYYAMQNIVREERRAVRNSDTARARYASPATASDRPRTRVWRAQGY